MSAQDKIIKPSHLITMDDIIREGNPTLRAVAKEVTLPLSDEDILLGEKMMQFLKHSQDPVMGEKLGLRAGVGLAAPQIDVSKRIIAVLVPNLPDQEGTPPKEAYSLQEVLYNPKIVSHSVQDAALADGEGCLSVDRVVEGYVVRHARVTVEYFDKTGEKHKIKLKGYNAIVVQHEIDHINGVMFYDRINPTAPFKADDNLLLLD
ncbi:peptide deformylase [Streptococcus dysgalactiae subsp. equisimilis]|uniref:peptide deformylase n=1 Tax=Streptococcus dysgalactiae TaxID=1334 RepID=UPI0003B09753|nr:peptide deformylase [Streptococcus dysgalactiae]BAN92663.1 peptide deformylase [Streptococcus dysgalactiae subsp. equisimilis 167]KKC21510.1 peptide deformylase [Streptococcus dysgalactiae subsp. equisimilis]OBZ04425.1 peptide deformylase [Streptococcus dysgalactiae subsp. equisimilis]OCX04318.1 peptide deformylase [Streptococcus dysgalactiae subsp. equisimilis]SLM20779.1 peptide deformylase [Streptococcus dysgalactiae subsp. equisimilis]